MTFFRDHYHLDFLNLEASGPMDPFSSKGLIPVDAKSEVRFSRLGLKIGGSVEQFGLSLKVQLFGLIDQ